MNKTNIKRITGFLKPFSKHANSMLNHNQNQRIILLYHGISKSHQFNCVAQNLFRDQISWIKEEYSVVPLFKLVEGLKFPTMYKSNLASITFDDGYVNFAELAVPILEKYGCHATVFIPAGKVGSFNDWDEGNSNFHKMPIMSYEQIRQLPKEFVEIGSHGISHLRMNCLPADGIVREIVESRLEIEQMVGKPVRFFAFPFGVYPVRCGFNFYENGKKLLRSYLAACTTWWGRYNSPKDIYTLRRIGIWDSDSFEDFVDKLDGHYDWLVAKEKIKRIYKFITSLPKSL